MALMSKRRGKPSQPDCRRPYGSWSMPVPMTTQSMLKAAPRVDAPAAEPSGCSPPRALASAGCGRGWASDAIRQRERRGEGREERQERSEERGEREEREERGERGRDERREE
eukprot:scaffold141993_cov29-Tisochrysis_lutea.AAC.4